MQPHELPVYREKDRILKALSENQVIVVESPTGSGKTTQLPLILHEAGYSKNGVVGVTQPRRIAAVSVCDYIARQIGSTVPGEVGYKMRFEDMTVPQTSIKIMTDGILLQELKADYTLSRYSVIMVDEAHERSLNIDFILGLLKRVLELRPEFKVIVSSATINAEVFSEYFNECPIVHIETSMYPVTIVYDPPAPENGADGFVPKIADIVTRAFREKREGDILVFLSGEKMIKDTLAMLDTMPYRKRLHLMPLYARLGKEEQERVFEPAPKNKIKVVAATNIAETSVTIDGITTVIDSGLAKLNYYNPRTFTASLIEGPISKASSNQRKGRAGRTRPGMCYRLYTKKEFDSRPLFTTEEIYRTDLSEVVLRMAELGITEFESFDFISSPGKQGIIGAIETLDLLEALTPDRRLSKIGEMMAQFPLLPKHSRIIVEGILSYPSVLNEILIATSFLTTRSPFLLPAGEELAARKAQHRFQDPAGDFVSYLKVYYAYTNAKNRERFCERNYLDQRTMGEIANIKEQLSQIVTEMGVAIGSGGSTADYLCAVSRGLIQFVCIRSARGVYRSLTAEKIQIHPGSVMYRENPRFIVAGEVVRTSRMYARSVSPLNKSWIPRISEELAEALIFPEKAAGTRTGGKTAATREKLRKEAENQFFIGNELFDLRYLKGKQKLVILPWERISAVLKLHEPANLPNFKNVRGKVTFREWELFSGVKLNTILRILPHFNLETDIVREWPKQENFSSENMPELTERLGIVLKLCPGARKGKALGFLSLETDRNGRYWFKCTRSFNAAVNQSIASLEMLADELKEDTDSETERQMSGLYRRLSALIES